MLLMNGDRPVLQFHIDDFFIKVLDNDFLPYPLKDYVKDSGIEIRKTMSDISALKDYLCSRTLNLSRENAKAILHSLSLPQRLKTNELLKITFACDALSMIDNYWVKDETDTRIFKDINLRNHHLRDAAYKISILGENISATKDIMLPDIGTDGMFAKTWVREPDKILLWKTDLTSDSIFAISEKKASDILDNSNIAHVKYDLFERDNKKITSCKCIANDDVSIINGYELKDWCDHTKIDFLQYIKDNFLIDFSNMVCVDYILANTDRHLGNILFLVDNKTNNIISFAPLMDHNQSLIAFDTVDDLIYEATNKSIKDTALEYYCYSNVQFDLAAIPIECQRRIAFLENHSIKQKQNH